MSPQQILTTVMTNIVVDNNGKLANEIARLETIVVKTRINIFNVYKNSYQPGNKLN